MAAASRYRAAGSACRVVWARPPTVVLRDGTFVTVRQAIPVTVCRRGRGASVSWLDFTIPLSGIEKQAAKYRALSRKLPCPSARATAAQLADEWGSFAKAIKRTLSGF